MNIDFQLLGQIAGAFSTLAFNPAFEGKGEDIGAAAGLVGLAFQQGALAESDARVLLAQLEEANAAGRGLTDEQKAQWRALHEASKAAIAAWNPAQR
jgi:hypothetical protein